MLILDEATSALDYLTERTVCEITSGTFWRYCLFITHRLATIVCRLHYVDGEWTSPRSRYTSTTLSVRALLRTLSSARCLNQLIPNQGLSRGFKFNTSLPPSLSRRKFLRLTRFARPVSTGRVIWTIAAGTTASLLWAFTGRVDQTITASGGFNLSVER